MEMIKEADLDGDLKVSYSGKQFVFNFFSFKSSIQFF
jgi:hypothetical protein